MPLAARLAAVKPSATVAVTAAVAELRRGGVEVIDLGAGEPDFDTPERIRAAAFEAIARGQTRYTPVAGLPELREAICHKLATVNDLAYEPRETMATCGGKHALFSAFHSLFGPGDEVLVPAPYWVSYSEMIRLAGATPVVVPTAAAAGFKLLPEDLEACIGPATRGLVLNSPCNPTGAAYDEEELAVLGAVLTGHAGVWLVLDDVYELLLLDGERPPHLVRTLPELRERAVIVNSVSKAFAMTGWRLGYAAAPARVIEAMVTIQGQTTSNPSTPAQAAAIEALQGPLDDVRAMAAELRSRRDYVVGRLGEIAGLELVPPRGALYAFPDVSPWLRASAGAPSSAGLCRRLLEEARVAVVPGDDFGAPTHVRISFAAAPRRLAAGLDALAGFLT